MRGHRRISIIAALCLVAVGTGPAASAAVAPAEVIAVSPNDSAATVISKAGGATVQEAMSAACPMIVNHVIPGQEEGNARFIVKTKSGTIARTHDEVIAAVQEVFANDAARWREWSTNIGRLGRPTAALEIAKFLLSI